MLTNGPLFVAGGRAELPPQSASPPDEGVTLWVIFSAAGAGVALAAFVVGFFLGKKGAKSQAEDATQSSRSKSSRKIPSKKPPPPPPSTRSSTMKDKLPSEVQGQPFFCETIADDDKDLEANAQRQGEHRREDSRARSSSRPRREDGRSRSRSRSRTIPPTNDAVRTAVVEATASAECPMTLWRCPPPPISVRHLPAGSWFRMRLGSRRVSENTSISMSVLL